MMKIWCNCGITQLYVKCGEWIAAGEEKKLEMACCQDQCPKIMSCGHRFVKYQYYIFWMKYSVVMDLGI